MKRLLSLLLVLLLLGTVLAVRPYCHNDHYWQVYFDTNDAITRVAQEAGWPAPTPASLTRMIQVADDRETRAVREVQPA